MSVVLGFVLGAIIGLAVAWVMVRGESKPVARPKQERPWEDILKDDERPTPPKSAPPEPRP